MLQLIQNLGSGATDAIEVPCRGAGEGEVLLRSRASLISAGTERMLIEFGRSGWIQKARSQPDKMAQVVEKARTDGLWATWESVRAKLDQPVPLGYSNAGVVLKTGPKVQGFRPGDRLVSNGPHAEVVAVPQNLCARIPKNVPDDHASFTVVGAVALEGIRLAAPALGETVVVTGLGLIGLIAVQLLRAQGCRVLGIDFDQRKLALAQSFGAETVNLAAGEDPVATADRFSRGRGVDAALVTASTKSNAPIHQAALMCRKRGRIVLVGVAGLELSREDFYKKELRFQVSCSYGPGRYDPAYEAGGHDYPYAYVRWTAQRNFEAVLDMIAEGRLQVEPLITHRFDFEHAADAYRLLESEEPYLGIVLQYPSEQSDADLLERRTALHSAAPRRSPAPPSLGIIGAGGYASKILIPAFQKAGARLVSIASSGGVSAAHEGRRFGFSEATTDIDAILGNADIEAVAIATRHDSHAELVCRALKAGKHVFVEKPLALTVEQLDRIEATWRGLPEPVLLTVGFNRRFAPQVVRIRELLAGVTEPKAFIYTVNAGPIPRGHWTQDPESGGGRILGEACHFVDLLRFLAGCEAMDMQRSRQSSDTVTLTMTYKDGSAGTVHYFANGHKSFPKERLEVFAGGRILVLDNFRRLRGYGWPRFRSMNLWRQNKGSAELAAAFVEAVRTGRPSPIPFDELLEVSRFTLKAASL